MHSLPLTLPLTDNKVTNSTASNSKSEDQSSETRNYANEVHNGDYDVQIISAFRCNFFDLRQLTSGITYNQHRSIFHKLAKFIGLPEDDDAVAFMLYRLFILNRRGIRDKIEGCDCCNGSKHLFAQPVESGDVHNSKKIPIEKILISREVEVLKKPPPRSIRKVSKQVSEFDVKKRKTSELYSVEYEPVEINQKPDLFMRQSSRSITDHKITEEQTKMAMEGIGIEMTCPRCGECDITDVQYKMGCLTIASTAILLLMCLIPCAFCPMIGTCCKDVMHICRHCKYILGIVAKRPWKNTMTWNWQTQTAVMPERFKKGIIKGRIASSSSDPQRKASIKIIQN